MKVADLPQVSALSVTEKLRLVEDLWNDIAAKADALPLPDWHVRELDRDLADYQKNPRGGAEWADVKARVLRRK